MCIRDRGHTPPGEPLYSFLTVLLSSSFRTWSSHFSLYILMKAVMLRPYAALNSVFFHSFHITQAGLFLISLIAPLPIGSSFHCHKPQLVWVRSYTVWSVLISCLLYTSVGVCECVRAYVCIILYVKSYDSLFTSSNYL